ncbi:hypothetical protein QC820_12335 [Halomonas mongoliensis]|uniref:Stress-induced bacterial acidophilic repeat motif protein n=1 Tax=Halomonas mongoliensis TaxID=321265 RepID=A0ABU1GNJ9_9GAMM|nr:hypothetical protein [Halomonas mongoliensis]MDR5893598.1 hypothetical protein [Halomonas mongoliensis]
MKNHQVEGSAVKKGLEKGGDDKRTGQQPKADKQGRKDGSVLKEINDNGKREEK